jgi:hypothetical protein
MKRVLRLGFLGLMLLAAAPVVSYEAPQQVKRIRLTVENAGNVARKVWPITQGVPFADGELGRGAPVRVVEQDGRILPTQSSTLATWNSDLKYVKWLLVDFQCDSGIRNGHIPVVMGTVARAMEKDPAGLAAAEERLKERLGKTPRKVSTLSAAPQERSLGVPRGYEK